MPPAPRRRTAREKSVAMVMRSVGMIGVPSLKCAVDASGMGKLRVGEQACRNSSCTCTGSLRAHLARTAGRSCGGRSVLCALMMAALAIRDALDTDRLDHPPPGEFERREGCRTGLGRELRIPDSSCKMVVVHVAPNARRGPSLSGSRKLRASSKEAPPCLLSHRWVVRSASFILCVTDRRKRPRCQRHARHLSAGSEKSNSFRHSCAATMSGSSP
jgi:hypothetical protein